MQAPPLLRRHYHFGWLAGPLLVVVAVVAVRQGFSAWVSIWAGIGAVLSILAAIDFPTRRLRRKSEPWAQLHFPGPNQETARAVAYALVDMLGVDFKQLTPQTDILADLGADEEIEWIQIQQAVEAELHCCFASQPVFTGRTISELVKFVAANHLPCPAKKPERSWCFLGYLDQSLEQAHDRN